jgi:hypothetical protein
MERTENRINRELLERDRQRAREEGRKKSDVIGAALKRYLDREDRRDPEHEEPSFEEILDGVADRQCQHGVEPLSEDKAMGLAVGAQHAYRRGE